MFLMNRKIKTLQCFRGILAKFSRYAAHLSSGYITRREGYKNKS